MNKHLFQIGPFKSHSGLTLGFKIECDALTDEDWKTFSVLIAAKVGRYSHVIGVKHGGSQLATYLCEWSTYEGTDPVIIVDDVLTTGASIEDARKEWVSSGWEVRGIVLFARGECPDWVTPIFTLNPQFN